MTSTSPAHTGPQASGRASLLVAAVFFLQLLDSTIITTSLPVMARDFGVSAVAMSIGITAYLLALAVVVPAAGWIGEWFGARQVLIVSVLTFTAASLVCALAARLDSFIAARILQGAAAGLMSPVGRMLVLTQTAKSDLVRSISTITWPALIAPVIGPPLGGWITETWGWQWNFLINVPLGLAAALAFVLLVPNQGRITRTPFDTRGYALTALAMILIMGGLEVMLAEHIALGAGLAVTGALSAIAAVIHLKRASAPLFDLTLMARPSFRLASMTAGSAQRTAINSTPFLLPLLFQLGFGLSVIQTGFLTLVYFLGNLRAKTVTTPLLRWFGFRALASVNGVFCALSIAVFAAVPADAPHPLLWSLLILSGAVRSVQFTTLNTLAYADVTAPERATAATLAAMTQQISMLFGVALAVALLRLSAFLRGSDTGITDLRLAFAGMGVIALLSALSFLRLDPVTGTEVSGHRLPSKAHGMSG